MVFALDFRLWPTQAADVLLAYAKPYMCLIHRHTYTQTHAHTHSHTHSAHESVEVAETETEPVGSQCVGLLKRYCQRPLKKSEERREGGRGRG